MMTGAQQVGLATIRSVLTRADALTAVRLALHELADGGAVAPPGLGLRTHHGEIHIKGAAFLGSRVLVVKVATGFPGNAPLDLPVNDGFSMVFDARTGACLAVLDDGGWQTEMRTAAAGALAAQLLAREDATVAAVLGAGAQARFQIEALADVRRLDRVHVWARRQDQSRQYAVEMRKRLSVEVVVARTVQEAVEVAEIVVTTTSSRTPLVRAAWLKPDAHVTAMGSDFPGKQELCTDVLGRADLVVADSCGIAPSRGNSSTRSPPVWCDTTRSSSWPRCSVDRPTAGLMPSRSPSRINADSVYMTRRWPSSSCPGSARHPLRVRHPDDDCGIQPGSAVGTGCRVAPARIEAA